MSTPQSIVTYVVEIAKDDPCCTIPGFSPYNPSPVSPSAVREAIVVDDPDLASIQLAHYWLKTNHWICQHNADVEEAEKAWKEAEDMKKLAEKKKAEIEEDWRRRVEQEERERRIKRNNQIVLYQRRYTV